MIVFITGSESTGKTQLAKSLAEYFQKDWIAEFARSYIEKLVRPYEFSDVEYIARQQFADIQASKGHDLIFIDTDLIITKIWFQKRFNKIPTWFQDNYKTESKGFYLICEPDLPWVEDPVRENPDIREELNKIYENEIAALNYPFHKISGTGEQRLLNAIGQIEKWLTEEDEK